MLYNLISIINYLIFVWTVSESNILIESGLIGPLFGEPVLAEPLTASNRILIGLVK